MSKNSGHAQTATLSIRVVPRSSKSEIVGFIRDELKLKLKSPPVEGAANEELVRVLAKEFGVSRSDIEIVSGHSSRQKRVCVTGLDLTHALSVLKAKS
jgi:uncharacterized protein (TIGR00251 family)